MQVEQNGLKKKRGPVFTSQFHQNKLQVSFILISFVSASSNKRLQIKLL